MTSFGLNVKQQTTENYQVVWRTLAILQYAFGHFSLRYKTKDLHGEKIPQDFVKILVWILQISTFETLKGCFPFSIHLVNMKSSVDGCIHGLREGYGSFRVM
jgi:hypothetical protein